MRYLVLLLAAIIIGSSCSTMKSSSSTATATTTAPQKKSGSPGFIETISIKPPKGKETIEVPPLKKENAGSTNSGEQSSIEFASPTLLKYAILMNAPVEELNNEKLIHFIDDWYGTKYRFGGEDKDGVDCSAFVQSFILALYGIGVPRTSREQFLQSERIKKIELAEGDLVFFHTRGKSKSISHVGVYLRNNKFIHASSSGGVMISDLNESYFKQRYVASGRVKDEDLSGRKP
jgi:cell wall-associated NlpC family hydrolase